MSDTERRTNFKYLDLSKKFKKFQRLKNRIKDNEEFDVESSYRNKGNVTSIERTKLRIR